jgi:hypothetical protein
MKAKLQNIQERTHSPGLAREMVYLLFVSLPKRIKEQERWPKNLNVQELLVWSDREDLHVTASKYLKNNAREEMTLKYRAIHYLRRV